MHSSAAGPVSSSHTPRHASPHRSSDQWMEMEPASSEHQTDGLACPCRLQIVLCLNPSSSQQAAPAYTHVRSRRLLVVERAERDTPTSSLPVHSIHTRVASRAILSGRPHACMHRRAVLWRECRVEYHTACCVGVSDMPDDLS